MFRLPATFLALCALVSASYALPIRENATLSKRNANDGRATHYEVGLGACGSNDVDSESVLAISRLIYGNGEYCNQWLQITNTANGNVKYGQMRDRCESCGQNDIDLSPSLFEALGADLNQGVLQVEWHFMDKGWSP
ncbi:hypothetical protein WOLCODRAFT_138096 [Wolfiporia cocos MD-104 SS10]|uniref:RlpA-like protein double-psi beta-barrel domain-containing protein n=1 Tax=Wolfiporia cocos (strain MD-104) TaxID=742152 RepID=A0A2H3K1I4_WOLCO|nr:hypothetical protein WOLCODRAFT_138096 [Wolfiporia cocos MD-104 SS10]